MAYLLVHPEHFPANDPDVIGPALDEGTPLAGFDDWYGARIGANAAPHERRVVLLDGFGLEDLDEDGELASGLTADGWEVAPCEPAEVGRVVRRLFLGHEGPVVVSGFARRDCVARAVQALVKLGLDVTLDEETTLPLSVTGAEAYLSACVPTEATLGAAR